MNVLVTLLNTKNMPSQVCNFLNIQNFKQISQKILTLIQKWGIRFEKDKDILPLFSEVYVALKNRNVPFPEYVPDQQ